MKDKYQRITQDKIGDEGEPLAIIENFCPFANTLVQAAKTRPFTQESSAYPGVRSPAPRQYAQLLYTTIIDNLTHLFGLTEDSISSINSNFAMINKKPEELRPRQTIPHYDVPEKNALACIHYLCPPKYGGTSFYRHTNTGYEFVDTNREATYLQSLQADIDKHGLPIPTKYINGSTNIFTRIASQEAVFNRALIYRASSLHSGNILDDHHDNAADIGRLTMTSFIVLK